MSKFEQIFFADVCDKLYSEDHQSEINDLYNKLIPADYSDDILDRYPRLINIFRAMAQTHGCEAYENIMLELRKCYQLEVATQIIHAAEEQHYYESDPLYRLDIRDMHALVSGARQLQEPEQLDKITMKKFNSDLDDYYDTYSSPESIARAIVKERTDVGIDDEDDDYGGYKDHDPVAMWKWIGDRVNDSGGYDDLFAFLRSAFLA